MPASYPNSIVTLASHSDNTDTIFAADINTPNAEIVAVETGLLNGLQHDLLPLNASGKSLGSVAKRWLKGWFHDVDIDGTLTVAALSVGAFPSGSVGVMGVGVGSTTVGLYSAAANELDLATAGVQAVKVNPQQQISSATQMRAQVYHSTTQSLSNATVTAVNFDTEDFDVGGLHDPVTNNTRFTIPTGGDGLWLLVGTASFASSAANTRRAYWRKNGAGQLNTETAAAANAGGNPCEIQTMALAPLVAGDYVELLASQDSGGNLNVGSTLRLNANQAFVVKLW